MNHGMNELYHLAAYYLSVSYRVQRVCPVVKYSIVLIIVNEISFCYLYFYLLLCKRLLASYFITCDAIYSIFLIQGVKDYSTQSNRTITKKSFHCIFGSILVSIPLLNKIFSKTLNIGCNSLPTSVNTPKILNTAVKLLYLSIHTQNSLPITQYYIPQVQMPSM